MDPVFDLSIGGEPKDDVVDIEELELEGNGNLVLSTVADVINVENHTLDQCKRALAEMMIIDELSFRFVEAIGFRKFWKPVGEKMEKQAKDVLNKLYDYYEKDGEVRQNVPSASPMPRVMVEEEDCDCRLNLASEIDTYLEEEYSSVCFSEVNKYLGDLCERRDSPNFDILVWWKNNSNKYPIFSKITRDVLAMPMSTVASESAFSTGGRILDPFQSSLSTSMVETLICTQNWLLMYFSFYVTSLVSLDMGLGALWTLD
ncbi:hypothetical protein RHSIM_Rhsim10G0144400 [Rhododendron simsii]|uniref:HAT C-terminal dimerisation domain-containing protein n=1 Tax=Rhododendron simsii TaxID=118357 RepID=A0A834GEJ9_RHOSS|nr:hypothetical protein RHSIM_Rhsim10G0144400 [Rhododendron simsii]